MLKPTLSFVLLHPLIHPLDSSRTTPTLAHPSPRMGPQMGPKRACDADRLPSTQEVCWRPQEAMEPAGGGTQGGRLRRALGHDQVLARRATHDARLLAAMSARDASAMDAARGSTAAAPGALGPRKKTNVPVRAAHGGARPANDRDWRSMASKACCRALVVVRPRALKSKPVDF